MSINPAAIPVVEENGTMTQRFRTYLTELESWIPQLGDGSPEGVVTAELYRQYIDRTGTTGAIEYRKMIADIGGDASMGWVLV